ncbi:hypothetical protein [Cyclobacterium marinum]|nr:hypothetical protein [Cyclobacterium marinum]
MSRSQENVHCEIVIAANVQGRDLRSVVNDIQQIIGDQIQFLIGIV